MANPLAIAAAGAGAAGVLGFKGSMAAARTAQQTAEYNAKVAENEAILLQRAKTREEANLRKASERFAATQTVATAASGIQMSGNPLQALADTYFNTELDALNIRYASEIEQTRAEATATLARAEGSARAAAYRTQAYGSLLEGGTRAATLMS